MADRRDPVIAQQAPEASACARVKNHLQCFVVLPVWQGDKVRRITIPPSHGPLRLGTVDVDRDLWEAAKRVASVQAMLDKRQLEEVRIVS